MLVHGFWRKQIRKIVCSNPDSDSQENVNINNTVKSSGTVASVTILKNDHKTDPPCHSKYDR